MKLRAAAAFLIPLLFACSVHASSKADASPDPGILARTMDSTLEILHLKHAPKQQDAPQLHHGLELKLDIAPDPIKLSQDREIKTTVTLFNRTKKFVDLDFPTTQRVEILVRDASGKVVNTWSEDQSFTNDPASVTVNPGERIEYTELVPTREMAEGQPYVIEVSFPSYPDLTIQQRVIPGK